MIEWTRQNVKRAQASYSKADYRNDQIKKSFMMYVIMDRRFDPQFRDQRILLQRGVVVWGSIIQANQILFDPNGSHASLPAAVMYAASKAYDASPDLLIEQAHSMYDLKGQTCTPDMQAFADKLANEMVADIRLPIPTGFTGGRQCYYATLMIARKHLPGNYLANGFFPVLIAPKETETVMVLPETYWDPQFRGAWES